MYLGSERELQYTHADHVLRFVVLSKVSDPISLRSLDRSPERLFRAGGSLPRSDASKYICVEVLYFPVLDCSSGALWSH